MNVKMNNGVIEFPYKISEGISTQYIALELLNKKLKSCREIIETSLEFKKNLISKISKHLKKLMFLQVGKFFFYVSLTYYQVYRKFQFFLKYN